MADRARTAPLRLDDLFSSDAARDEDDLGFLFEGSEAPPRRRPAREQVAQADDEELIFILGEGFEEAFEEAIREVTSERRSAPEAASGPGWREVGETLVFGLIGLWRRWRAGR